MALGLIFDGHGGLLAFQPDWAGLSVLSHGHVMWRGEAKNEGFCST
jgi:hypothetical protein